MKYGQFSPKEKPTLITPDNFFCKQKNDRDKLIEMGHRDTLVFLKLASFVNKILIEISCYKWIIDLSFPKIGFFCKQNTETLITSKR